MSKVSILLAAAGVTLSCAALATESPRGGSIDNSGNVALLGSAVKCLPEREQKILRLRFVEDMTQSEIAAEIGVSQMQISRLLRQSLERLAQITRARD